jgi:nucleoside-diphosphate-sugar epimerase
MPYWNDDLATMLAVNTLGTQRLLNGLPCPPGRVAFVSTIDVYGRPVENQVLGEKSLVNPETDYALSKWAGEQIVRLWCIKHGVTGAVLRLSHIYGSNDPSNKVIQVFCRAVAEGHCPRINGTGDDIRQPIQVRDVATAVLAFLKSGISGSSPATYLIAGQEQISIRQLAAMTMEVGGLAGEPEMVANGDTHLPTYYRLDLTYTHEHLGWSARIPLRTGLQQLVQHLRSERQQR